jgi:gluconolactonase
MSPADTTLSDLVDGPIQPTPAAYVAFLEGPAALADGRLFFTDIWNNRILCWNEQTGQTTVFREPSGRANGLLFDAAGRLLACEGTEFGPGGGRRVTRTDIVSGTVEIVTDQYEGQPYNSPNDIAARRDGVLFFTDPCYWDRSVMRLTHESVYRVDLDGTVTPVITQPAIERPNGVALSPDERTLYVIDSCSVPGGNRKLWAFDLDARGNASGQRELHDFAPGRGGDGMAVDQAGRLYVAAGIARPRGPHETDRNPPCVYVFEPTGTPLGRIPIPEDVITNVTFGGPDLRTLFVTAGRTLYRLRMTTPGYVVHRST